MKDNSLSQEEINSLMNRQEAENIKELSENEINLISKAGNITVASADKVLKSLLNQNVQITTSRVQIMKMSAVIKEMGKSCVSVRLEYTAGLKGSNLFIMKTEAALTVANLIIGKENIDGKENQPGEIHLSALEEMFAQISGSISSTLSRVLNNNVNILQPEVKMLPREDVNKYEVFPDDKLLIATFFKIKIGDIFNYSLIQLSPLNFTGELIKNIHLGKNQDTNTIGVHEASFPEFNNNNIKSQPNNMDLISDVPLHVTVRLGQSEMTINEILELGEGSIIELDKLAGEPVDLYVNGKLIAKGEVVVIDENFGFRVKDIIKPIDRINNI